MRRYAMAGGFAISLVIFWLALGLVAMLLNTFVYHHPKYHVTWLVK